MGRSTAFAVGIHVLVNDYLFVKQSFIGWFMYYKLFLQHFKKIDVSF